MIEAATIRSRASSPVKPVVVAKQQLSAETTRLVRRCHRRSRSGRSTCADCVHPPQRGRLAPLYTADVAIEQQTMDLYHPLDPAAPRPVLEDAVITPPIAIGRQCDNPLFFATSSLSDRDTN